MRMRRMLRLSEGQQSALECSGAIADPLDRRERLLRAAWLGDRLALPRKAARVEALAFAIIDASNAEDENPTQDEWTRKAARALSALAGRVLKANRTGPGPVSDTEVTT